MVLNRLFIMTVLFFVMSVAFCATLTSVATAHAQTEFINASEGQSLRVTLSPQYPKAYEKVSVSVEDFSRDINNLTISWSLNGKVIQKGIGLKTVSFTTSFLGSVSNLTISIGGESHTVAIRPTAVDLIWQASSYVPPLYEGKALHSNQDPLVVVAEPFFLTSKGARLDPNTLTYTWSQNGKIVQGASGYGKRSFTVAQSVLSRDIDVDVTISSGSGEYRAAAHTTISEHTPELLVYEDSPLYGVRTAQALNRSTFSLGSKPETAFAAVPLYFSRGTSGVDNVTTYQWAQNGVPTSQKGRSIIFRTPDGAAGTSAISVEAKSSASIMQAATAAFTINFAQNTQAPAGTPQNNF